MRKRFTKKMLLPITFLLIMSTLLSGCASKKVEYAGSSYEQIIGNQLEEMEALAEATENAKQGVIEVAPEASQKALEQFNSGNNNNGIIEILIKNSNAEGARKLPSKISYLYEYVGNYNWSKAMSDTESFLGYEYSINFYTAKSPILGTAVYNIVFSGSPEELYNEYTKYLQIIENNFKPGYGEAYNLVYSNVSDMIDNPYVIFYDLNENGLFLESMGIYNEATGEILHSLVFYRTDCEHLIDGEYGWMLYPIKAQIESGDAEMAKTIELCNSLEGFSNEIVSYKDNIIEDEIVDELAIRYGY